jgi:type VI protein secretion system component Hcp
MKLVRLLAPLVLLSCLATSVSAASVDYYLKIDGIDGEALVSTFDITGPGQPPKIGLLVPAVQKVREAAARSRELAQLSCAGTHVPRVVLTCRKSGSATNRDAGAVVLTIELQDLVVSSWQTRGGVFVAAGDVNGDGQPYQEVSMTFSRATWTWPDVREPFSLDCSSGVCACAP